MRGEEPETTIQEAPRSKANRKESEPFGALPLKPAWTISLEALEGPLDLLLHLINKNQIDISNIPIALITRQYLDYLELMRTLDIAIAGEYLQMAATLLYIKSKMLLPAPPSDSEAEAVHSDPREIITKPLKELMEIKKKAELLLARPLLGRDVFTREKQSSAKSLDSNSQEVSIRNVSVFDLLKAYTDLMENLKRRAPVVLEKRTYRIEEEIKRIKELVLNVAQVSFYDLLVKEEKGYAIVVFIAVLELAKRGVIKLFQRDDGEFLIISVHNSSLRAPEVQSQT